MQQQGVVLLTSLALLGLGQAEIRDDVESASFWSGQDVSLGKMIFPHFHALGVIGDSSIDPAELAVGDHDPMQNVDLLSLEPGLSLRLGEHIEGFITSSYLTNSDGDFTGGVEEAFLKLTDLPGGFELRGGRFFNRVGFQNALHTHSWDYVDQYLVNGRLLQEGELATIGGEITWHLPTRFPAAFSLGIGAPPTGHGHGHGHEEEAHGFFTEDFVVEGANFDDYIVSANLLASWRYNDFHQFTGTANFSMGENGMGRDTRIFGLGLEYLWRENGLEAGGRSFRWRTEAMYRRFEATGWPIPIPLIPNYDGPTTYTGTLDLDDFGFYTSATYRFNDQWEASLRAEYVDAFAEGAEIAPDRWRISPALTWSLNRPRNLFMRLQYNYDQLSHHGHEHGVWLGLGINWGGTEVR